MVKITRIKPLKSTLKEKKRYLVFEVISKKSINSVSIKNMIFENLKSLFGVFGAANMGLMFLEFENNKGIVRVNNKFVDHLKAGFCLLNENNLVLRTLGVSGTLKKVRSKYL